MISASAVPSITANSVQVMKAAQGAAALGHTVLLMLPGEQSLAFDELAGLYGLQTPFEIKWLKAPRAWRRYDLAWKALQRAQAWKADLVYTWMPQAALLALLRDYPVVLEMHDMPSGVLGPLVFRLFWRTRGKKRLLPITHALLARLAAAYRLKPAPGEAVVAPNGVDLERYENLPQPGAARKALDLPEAFTAAYSGHFYPGRGMDMLFTLAQRCPGIQFLWMGGKPEAVQYWQGRLQQENMHNVTLTGFIPNRSLPGWQAAADILLMPYERRIAGSSGGDSAAIASPMKMFEYLACGRTILTSDLPVIREVLNERNAWFCPPEDEPAWRKALLYLQTDPAMRRTLASQARLDAAGYTWQERARKALAGF